MELVTFLMSLLYCGSNVKPNFSPTYIRPQSLRSLPVESYLASPLPFALVNTIIKSHPNKTTVPPTSLPVCTWENTVVHSGGERESEREREIGGHLVSAIHLEAKQC